MKHENKQYTFIYIHTARDKQFKFSCHVKLPMPETSSGELSIFLETKRLSEKLNDR